MKKKWIKNDCNEVLEGRGFYISNNPIPWSGVSMFASDEGSSETALVKPNSSQKFKILNGDFRKDYEKVINKGYPACLKVYNKYKNKFDSSWTSK